MKSMTGYGKATINRDDRELTIELKSVNHRFLDLNIKLPRAFNAFEDTIRKQLSARFSRGHIDVYVNYVDKKQRTKSIEVDSVLAQRLVEVANKLCKQFDIKNDFAVNSLMNTQDIISISYGEDNAEELLSLISDTLHLACDKLDSMRTVEGVSMSEDICSRLNLIEGYVSEIKQFAPQIIEEHQSKLTTRIRAVLEDVNLDESKLVNEVAFFVDKSNIDEEIARLNSHIVHTRDIINDTDQIGRKLDFIVQEFNREANTICSKSNNVSLTNIGLKLKNEIEKVREQVQNIE